MTKEWDSRAKNYTQTETPIQLMSCKNLLKLMSDQSNSDLHWLSDQLSGEEIDQNQLEDFTCPNWNVIKDMKIASGGIKT